jgi:hypothetical protein
MSFIRNKTKPWLWARIVTSGTAWYRGGVVRVKTEVELDLREVRPGQERCTGTPAKKLKLIFLVLPGMLLITKDRILDNETYLEC